MQAGNRHKPSFVAARSAADAIRKALDLGRDERPVGIILGTGWGDALKLDDRKELPFGKIPGFNRLSSLEGHARTVVTGTLGGTRVTALAGRVHLYEAPADPGLHAMVRLQTEMLIHLGAQRLIMTCAAGSLDAKIKTGSFVAIDGFVSAFAPEMPLYGGEFPTPDKAIDLECVALDFPGSSLPGRALQAWRGGYVMLRGPSFEGSLDKQLLAASGAKVVGMSMLPDACVAALYAEEGVRVVPIAHVTNGIDEATTHDDHLTRSRQAASRLASLLADTVRLSARALARP
jgi:purine-nucleoside phosphorylase